MTGTPQDDALPDTLEALSEQVRATREQLGQTLEALVEKTDVKARAQQRVGDIKTQVEHAATDAKVKAVAVAHHLQRDAPRPVIEAAGAARRHPTVLLAASAAVLAWVIFLRRTRK
ncbi:DUF3618 domain-containing protein [Streptomyces sp. NPDC059165]|uniref:DUF3618 domain-containing protein n=1 Tax=Streptomyces sp. NPDC059165 TaxID=3346751 RepID=UPI0036A0531E